MRSTKALSVLMMLSKFSSGGLVVSLAILSILMLSSGDSPAIEVCGDNICRSDAFPVPETCSSCPEDCCPSQPPSPTYWIDESTDFTGNGCPNTDLNTVTSSLRNRLNSDGWTGTRWTNANAWPQDFYEQTFPGLAGIDSVAGDSRILSVYAGHGNRALLQFGFPRNSRCLVTLDTQSRMGTLAGDEAAYMMYVTSCTINTGSLSRHFNQQVRQSFGYHNSPAVKDNQPRDFYEETNSLRNSRAWIEEMEDRPGWFTGDNSPITLTFGLNQGNCLAVQNTARLRGRVLLSDAPEPHAWWCSVMFDNGDDGCRIPSPPPPPSLCPRGQFCCEPGPNNTCRICVPIGAECP
ncbi:MAG: DUF6345 domain-containing protein [Gammaproteobacteria bacterium]